MFCFDLVQRAHGHFGDIVGDELPAGALGVAGGEALSVPQVPCRDQDGSVSFELMAAHKRFRCGSPLSSTAKTEVRPTESCLRDCRGGDGMWYQHSPAGGRMGVNYGLVNASEQKQRVAFLPAGFCWDTDPL